MAKRTPTSVAREDARKLIAKNELPSYKELAKRWGCSTQMVGYILRSVRKSTSTKTTKKSRPVKTVRAKKSSQSHPILNRIRAVLSKAENDLLNAEGYISAIPGLAASEINHLVRKSQSSVWSSLHGELTSAVEQVEAMAKTKRKKRSAGRKAVAKKVVSK